VFFLNSSLGFPFFFFFIYHVNLIDDVFAITNLMHIVEYHVLLFILFSKFELLLKVLAMKSMCRLVFSKKMTCGAFDFPSWILEGA